MTMLDVKNIGVKRSGVWILRGVSVCLSAGELVVMVGPNGAGKSTLLEVMVGDATPEEGRVTLSGKPLKSWSPIAQARMRAVVRQKSTLTFPFTVREVVEMGWMPHDGELGQAAVVSWAIKSMGLNGLDDQRYPTLSGGEQQRVHLARGMVQLRGPSGSRGRVKAMVLDEPTSSLDPAASVLVMEAVQRLTREGVGALVVMHDLNLASLFADRLVVLCQGRVVADGPPDEVLRQALFERVYGTPIALVKHPGGGRPMVLPVRSPADTRDGWRMKS